jgi:hypothetical protein
MSLDGYRIVQKPDDVTVEDRALRVVTLNGNRADPKTGLSFTIKIQMDAAGVTSPPSILVYAEGHDFGGASGTPNYTHTDDRRILALPI